VKFCDQKSGEADTVAGLHPACFSPDSAVEGEAQDVAGIGAMSGVLNRGERRGK